jgi:hypothetical protein
MIASDLLMDKVERLIIDDPYRKEFERRVEMSATDIQKNEYNPITASHWLRKIRDKIKLH